MFSLKLTDAELISQLKAKYERTPPGHCEVCGTTVAVEPHEGGYPLPWSCPAAREELAAAQAAGAAPEVIEALQAHIKTSRWEDFRQGGDKRVMELIARFEAQKATTA